MIQGFRHGGGLRQQMIQQRPMGQAMPMGLQQGLGGLMAQQGALGSAMAPQQQMQQAAALGVAPGGASAQLPYGPPNVGISPMSIAAPSIGLDIMSGYDGGSRSLPPRPYGGGPGFAKPIPPPPSSSDWSQTGGRWRRSGRCASDKLENEH